MQTSLRWNRRGFLGTVAAFAVSTFTSSRGFGSTGSRAAQASPTKLTGLGQTGNVYDELGVTTIINGEGTMTTLGGSLIRPEVEAVMQMAAEHFVSIPELEIATGKRVAEMLKLPPGYGALVTSGAAAAIQSGYAGILTGDNETLIQQLPDLTGMKSEVIIQKAHRNPFDHQIRGTGVKLVEIETREQLRHAIGPQTAALHFTNFANAQGQIKVEEWVKIAREVNLPTLIDAAADTPPISHLWDYANMGYDLITFSGGKAIRGPQCAGLLLGRQDLVHYAMLNSSPYEDTLNRLAKVGKEEMVGMVKALELYLAEDQVAMETEWWNRLNTVSQAVSRVPGVTVERFVPDIANHVPHIRIVLDQNRVKATPREINQQLRAGTPSIVLATGEHGEKNIITMNSFMLKPGEDKIIAERLAEALHQHSS
jgi:L-seryl-tRNA(Ser) seleniumtransferase